MMRTQILVVEDEIIIADLLQKVLAGLGYENSQRCRKFEEAKELIYTQDFGLVILDINLSGENKGLELGSLCEQLTIPYFFLTSYSDKRTFSQALSLKPGSYVIKPFNKEDIMVAVELTLQGSTTEKKEKLKKAVKAFRLSKREAEILKFAFEKTPNPKIGEMLSLSLNTIKYHLKHIYHKMGVSSKEELAERVERVWREN